MILSSRCGRGRVFLCSNSRCRASVSLAPISFGTLLEPRADLVDRCGDVQNILAFLEVARARDAVAAAEDLGVGLAQDALDLLPSPHVEGPFPALAVGILAA